MTQPTPNIFGWGYSSFPKNKELFSTIVVIKHVTCTVLVEEMLSQYFLEWDFIVPVNLKLFST